MMYVNLWALICGDHHWPLLYDIYPIMVEQKFTKKNYLFRRIDGCGRCDAIHALPRGSVHVAPSGAFCRYEYRAGVKGVKVYKPAFPNGETSLSEFERMNY